MVIDVSSAVLAIVCLLVGVAAGAALVRWRDDRSQAADEADSVLERSLPEQAAPPSLDAAGLQRLFNAIAGVVVLVEMPSNSALVASSAAHRLGLVDTGRISVPEITAMLGDVYRGANNRIEIVRLKRSPFAPASRVDLRVRTVAIDPTRALLFATDVSNERRVEQVRRDFVANVSHELKTPVGALSLLAEATLAAADEPGEVRHFAERMRVESARLAHLVTDIVDLSRLQAEDPMRYADEVSVDAVIAEAVDAVQTAAVAGEIEIVADKRCTAQVFGVEAQLVMAVRNLLANAIAYSPSRTRVAIGCRTTEDLVEITVTDQGIGIPVAEQDRIFERFYRIDQARSRETGGTGLGLSIVKHVCQNHGGKVGVWSIPGEGSTFKLTLPRLRKPLADAHGSADAAAVSEQAESNEVIGGQRT